MTIYFSAAQTDILDFHTIYQDIIAVLNRMGHQVYAFLDDKPEDYPQALERISHCDIAILEVSSPSSLEMGYQLTLAREKRKPIIALYQEGHRPSFFTETGDENLVWLEYTPKSLQDCLEDGLDYVAEQQDVRFNLLLSASMNRYVERVSKERRLSKSQFIRNLILEHQRRNGEG